MGTVTKMKLRRKGWRMSWRLLVLRPTWRTEPSEKRMAARVKSRSSSLGICSQTTRRGTPNSDREDELAAVSASAHLEDRAVGEAHGGEGEIAFFVLGNLQPDDPARDTEFDVWRLEMKPILGHGGEQVGVAVAADEVHVKGFLAARVPAASNPILQGGHAAILVKRGVFLEVRFDDLAILALHG